ncbi:MAG: class I SAM-dependent methyltransferase [Bacteroidota bacterium]
MPPLDPTQRFSDRVADYLRYRPSYPSALLDHLQEQTALAPDSRIADIGSGTGKLTELLIARGWDVYAVEPNRPMQMAAEALLKQSPNFHSIPGTAAATTLPARTIDLITVAQAFHWFDPAAFRSEAQRILQPSGQAAIIYNSRRLTPGFMLRYHELMVEQIPGYHYTRKHEDVRQALVHFFGHEHFTEATFPYHQTFDWPGLEGRLRSASYCPKPDHPGYSPLMAQLRQLFDSFAIEGHITYTMDNVVYLGPVLAS